MSSHEQPSLFDEVRGPDPALERLARVLPSGIHFGTSTWTYDGWAGDVYHRAYRGPQPARRLEEYARYPLFSTVGIDSAFYDPPSDEELAAYARALPPGFPCVSKVWDRITAKRFGGSPKWGNLAGMQNPDFLNAELFAEAVIAPYARTFRDHAGCFVFEFQTMRGRDLPPLDEWTRQLDGFLARLPGDFRYAVELRNPELLHERHGDVLRAHGVAHVFNSWTEMPTIGEQLDLSWTFTAPFTVARALLKPGERYTDAVRRFQPYERVQEPVPELRFDLVRLIREAARRRVEAFILANNRAEGNAPGTIRAVMEMWRDGDAGTGEGV
jgi:uncharacterized protein YecE (DUF72 family)